MAPSSNCIDLIKKFEGLFLKAYKCPAGVPTIGYGSTMWNDGKKVEMGQVITLEDAEKLLMWEVMSKTKALPKMNLTQNQHDSIISFCYNLGVGAFLKSTLYKKININPNDSSIRDEFMKWTKARVKGVLTELPGLVKRRKAEADLYFK
jgi:lysozyme